MERKWVFLLFLCAAFTFDHITAADFRCKRFTFTHKIPEFVNLSKAMGTPGMDYKVTRFEVQLNSTDPKLDHRDNDDSTCQEMLYAGQAREFLTGWAKCESILMSKVAREYAKDRHYLKCSREMNTIHSGWTDHLVQRLDATRPACPRCPDTSCPSIDTADLLQSLETEILRRFLELGGKRAAYGKVTDYVVSLLWMAADNQTTVGRALDSLFRSRRLNSRTGGETGQQDLSAIVSTISQNSDVLQTLLETSIEIQEWMDSDDKDKALLKSGQATLGLLSRASIEEQSQMQGGLTEFVNSFQRMWMMSQNGAAISDVCPELDVSTIGFGSDFTRPMDLSLSSLINRTAKDFPPDTALYIDEINEFIRSWFYVSESCDLFTSRSNPIYDGSSHESYMCEVCSSSLAFATIHTNGSNLSILLWSLHVIGHLFTASVIFLSTRAYYTKQIASLTAKSRTLINENYEAPSPSVKRYNPVSRFFRSLWGKCKKGKKPKDKRMRPNSHEMVKDNIVVGWEKDPQLSGDKVKFHLLDSFSLWDTGEGEVDVIVHNPPKSKSSLSNQSASKDKPRSPIEPKNSSSDPNSIEVIESVTVHSPSPKGRPKLDVIEELPEKIPVSHEMEVSVTEAGEKGIELMGDQLDKDNEAKGMGELFALALMEDNDDSMDDLSGQPFAHGFIDPPYWPCTLI